ncbi:hypothetical protein dsx2_2461 [Desulfovibrio sp. X2]|uniref:hypothetical protein n=1 Tax=Desulfovibrio sp. X2 TaxID=941449 RepID=UPI0003588296|nr:hypothetical protein [Desulfovibrio sp. X2]EPR43101.1 hypothetical protein dsx2_2461 [Desulfovibrio sp. X2]
MPSRRVPLLPVLLAVALAAVLLVPAPARAGGEDSPSVSAGEQYTARGSVAGGPAAASVARTSLIASALPFTLEYDLDRYSWRDADRLPFVRAGREPWKTLHLLTLDLDYAGKLVGKTGFFTELEGYSGFESETAGSLGANLSGGLTYQLLPDLTAGAGATLELRPVDRVLSPILMLNWRDASSEGFSASLGYPENTLAYRLNPALDFRLAQTYDDSFYRLADDSGVDRGRYLEVMDTVVGLYADYSPLPHLTCTIGLQYTLGRRFDFYGSDGNKRDAVSFGSAPGGYISVNYAF